MLFQPDIDALLERLSLPTWRVPYSAAPAPQPPPPGPEAQKGSTNMEDLTNSLEDFRKRLACPCCGRNQTTDDFAMALLFAERQLQKPFVITSGYRCAKHNQDTPGHADDSPALYGVHADIAYFTSFEGLAILKAILASGFERVRLYDLKQALTLGRKSAHIHVDRHPRYQTPSLTFGSYVTI